ncbi:uncharacterized protein LOC134796175 isoform X2 [Cydia splendana]|uniref:uncharacterized protein LOC134796175 isoform X2 n=1 Tax=Cydia splendana TaxID=1100963 RepID=UPI0028F4C202
MLPFLISKTKLLPLRKEKPKEKNQKPSLAVTQSSKKEKSFFITGDNLYTVKQRRVKRRPLLPSLTPSSCDCNLLHLTRIVINYAPKSRKRIASNIVLSMTAWGATGQRKRMKLPSVLLPKKVKKEKPLNHDSDEFFKKLENQLKALKLGKVIKSKNKADAPPASHRSKSEKDTNDGSETVRGTLDGSGDGEIRRRGKKHRKRPTGSDRLTSAGLAAQSQQDPETQIAGIGTDSQNPSSRGSIAPVDDDVIVLPVIKQTTTKKTDSFLDDDILKYLHREVDEEAIETEFDAKRRYVLEEALRTRPERPPGQEMQTLLRELKVPVASLGDWLHIPRVFSRQSAQFSLPIDSNELENITPMQYAARFVTLKKSKQLLYLTVLRRFRPESYRMPIQDIEAGLALMMGGILNTAQVEQFRSIMQWPGYEEEDIPDEIKLTLEGHRERRASKDSDEPDVNTLKYRTWCGLCAICERMYGRFPPRDKDPPDGMELSDFTMVETKLAMLKVNAGLIEVLNTIRVR